MALYEGSRISTYFAFDWGKLVVGYLASVGRRQGPFKMGICGCSHIAETVESLQLC